MSNSTDNVKHPGPLSGLKVIDLTQYILGPVCTQILGDMGADVIKVETPEGDLNRDIGPQRYPHMSALFLGMNRNKRSVVLDLHNQQAKAALYKMIETADVFIHSTRKKAAQKLGIDYKTLSAINPRLIYAAGQGYTSGGPDEDRPAYDDVIQGESGISGINYLAHGEPYYFPMAFCDKFCGYVLASSVSMALYSREKTGMGQQVELPMLETVMSFNLIEHLWTGQFDHPQESLGYGRALMKERKPFATQDGYICLMATSDLQWGRLFKALGAPEMSTDPRYEKLVQRSMHFPQLYAWIAEKLKVNTSQFWLKALNDADIPCGQVRMLPDLPTDPYLKQTGFFHSYEHVKAGHMITPSIPIKYSETPGQIRTPPPILGEHTREVLAEYGFDAQQIKTIQGSS
jgi:crotonobetainyl-CoA:carnitine CoA-transferase CaiB-like acyl-CoA transferase